MVSTWEMFCNDKKSNMNAEKVGLDLTKTLIWLNISSYSHVFCETKKPMLKTIVKFKWIKSNCTYVHYRVKTLWSLCLWLQSSILPSFITSQSVHLFSCAYSCSASQYAIILSTSRCLYWGASHLLIPVFFLLTERSSQLRRCWWIVCGTYPKPDSPIGKRAGYWDL